MHKYFFINKSCYICVINFKQILNMKKIILSAVAIFTVGVVSAQIKTDAGTFVKPGAGTVIMEVTMTPDIAGGGIFSLPTLNNDLGLVGIKARKFSSDTRAMRFGANLSVLNSGEEDVDTEFSLGVSAEGNVGYVSSNGDAVVPDPLDPDADPADPAGAGKSTKLGIGANLLAGFDYYIMPKIYLGAEVSYGLAITSTTPDGGDGVTKLQLAPGITPSFRLGWQF
jgi:hypothetical protein